MNSDVIHVLHLAPHIGGGVGSVLLDWLKNAKYDSDTKHIVACLDSCQLSIKETLDAEELIYYDDLYLQHRDMLYSLIQKADVVLLHYWNHPLLTRLLIEEGLPASRLLCWCHISGLYEPCIVPEFLINICEKVIFTSDVSMDSPILAQKIASNPEKFTTIHSTRDLSPYLRISEERQYPEFGNRLLYVGTVSFTKLHPNALLIMSQLCEMGFNITVIGGPDHEHMSHQLLSNLSSVRFLGPIRDITPFIIDSDIFVYPLAPKHYGTGEQSILEAMAAGLPVIAFNNPAESAIVINNQTGCLASSTSEFVGSILPIAQSSSIRKSMAAASVSSIRDRFSLEKNHEAFKSLFRTAILFPKLRRRVFLSQHSGMDVSFMSFLLSSFHSHSYHELCSYRESGNELVNRVSESIVQRIENGEMIWNASTKGSPFHYSLYFPESSVMKQLTQRLRTSLCLN